LLDDVSRATYGPHGSIRDTFNPTLTEITTFPIFPCNAKYLKAVMNVLETQMTTLQILEDEKSELFSTDVARLARVAGT
jgi:hypothetical protein